MAIARESIAFDRIAAPRSLTAALSRETTRRMARLQGAGRARLMSKPVPAMEGARHRMAKGYGGGHAASAGLNGNVKPGPVLAALVRAVSEALR